MAIIDIDWQKYQALDKFGLKIRICKESLSIKQKKGNNTVPSCKLLYKKYSEL